MQNWLTANDISSLGLYRFFIGCMSFLYDEEMTQIHDIFSLGLYHFSLQFYNSLIGIVPFFHFVFASSEDRIE